MSRRQKAPGELGKVTPRKLKSGRWQARVEIRDGLGQLVPISATADNEAGAILAIAEKANAVWAGAFIEVTGDTTVEALGSIWINQLRQDGTQPTTIQAYQDSLRTLILARISAYRVSALTPAFCDSYLRTLGAESASKARKARNVLSQMLRIAVLHKVFPANPIREVSRIPSTKPVKLSYDLEQLQVLFRLMSEFQGKNPGRRGGRRTDPQIALDVMRIALGTSARPGEVLAIREEDVQFSDRVLLNINGTIVRVKRENAPKRPDGTPGPLIYRQPYPKNDDQARTVHVPDLAVEPLRRLVSQYRENEFKLLFTTGTGNPIDQNNVRRVIRDFRAVHDEDLRAMGMDPDLLTPKAFRKTAATVVSQEINPEAAQDLLGHWNVVLTKDSYIEPTKVVTAGTAEALDRRFAGL